MPEQQLFYHTLITCLPDFILYGFLLKLYYYFQFFSAVHFCLFKFNSFHSVNLFPQNASFFVGSSRVLCLVMFFSLLPSHFHCCPGAFFVFLHSLPSLVLHALRFPFGVAISVLPFGLCPPMIKTQNTEQAPCLIFRKQGKKYLYAGKTQNKHLKSLLLSHISSLEHTKQRLYSHN